MQFKLWGLWFVDIPPWLVNIASFLWLKFKPYLLPVGLPILIIGFFMPWGDSLERPSWFNKVMLSTLGHHIVGPYILPEMRELCDEYGPPVKGEVAGVKGYAFSSFKLKDTLGSFKLSPDQVADVRVGCYPCNEELIRFGYDFIEAFYVSALELTDLERKSKFQKPAKLRGRDGPVPKTGWYRYSLFDRSAAPKVCQPVPDGVWMADHRKVYFRTKCIGIEKIPAPTARYLVENLQVIQQEVNGLFDDGLILRTTTTITDRREGEVLASQNTFTYWRNTGYPSRANMSKMDHLSVSRCGGGYHFFPTQQILKPAYF